MFGVAQVNEREWIVADGGEILATTRDKATATRICEALWSLASVEEKFREVGRLGTDRARELHEIDAGLHAYTMQMAHLVHESGAVRDGEQWTTAITLSCGFDAALIVRVFKAGDCPYGTSERQAEATDVGPAPTFAEELASVDPDKLDAAHEWLRQELEQAGGGPETTFSIQGGTPEQQATVKRLISAIGLGPLALEAERLEAARQRFVKSGFETVEGHDGHRPGLFEGKLPRDCVIIQATPEEIRAAREYAVAAGNATADYWPETDIRVWTLEEARERFSAALRAIDERIAALDVKPGTGVAVSFGCAHPGDQHE